MLDSVPWVQVDSFRWISFLYRFIGFSSIRRNTMDVINWNVFSIRTWLCIGSGYYNELVIGVLYHYDVCSTFRKRKILEPMKWTWASVFRSSMLWDHYYFLDTVALVAPSGYWHLSSYLKHDVKHLNVFKRSLVKERFTKPNINNKIFIMYLLLSPTSQECLWFFSIIISQICSWREIWTSLFLFSFLSLLCV